MATGKGVAAVGEVEEKKTAIALKKAIVQRFAMNPYELRSEIVEKGRSYAVIISIGPGKGKARQDTTIAGMTKYLKQQVNFGVADVEKVMLKKPAGKPSRTPVADSVKNPPGLRKLKSYLYENNIDLPTLKKMIKFV